MTLQTPLIVTYAKSREKILKSDTILYMETSKKLNRYWTKLDNITSVKLIHNATDYSLQFYLNNEKFNYPININNVSEPFIQDFITCIVMDVEYLNKFAEHFLETMKKSSLPQLNPDMNEAFNYMRDFFIEMRKSIDTYQAIIYSNDRAPVNMIIGDFVSYISDDSTETHYEKSITDILKESFIISNNINFKTIEENFHRGLYIMTQEQPLKLNSKFKFH